MTPRPGRRVRIACAVLLVLWCMASWTLSSQSDPEGYVGVHLHLNDKVEHLIEYGAGGFLAAGALGSVARVPRWMAAVIFCGLWGVSDEIHQSFVPGRDSSVLDVAADVTGAAIGALVFSSAARRLLPTGGGADEPDGPTKELRRP